MLRRLINWWKKTRHQHDFEMEFPDDKSLRWVFRCKCGLETNNMETATSLQGKRSTRGI